MQRPAAAADFGRVGEARGVGLIGALEIVMDKSTRDQYPPEVKAGAQIAAAALAKGLIVRALPGDVIGICPPLIITKEQIDELFDALASAIDNAPLTGLVLPSSDNSPTTAYWSNRSEAN